MWMLLTMLFTVLISFALIIALPVMLGSALTRLWREHDVVPLLRFLSIAGGLAIGMALAWYFVVAHEGWNLSFGETFYAMGHSDIYGDLEDAAEDYVFFTLFFGNVCAILAGIAGWLATKRRRQFVLTN